MAGKTDKLGKLEKQIKKFKETKTKKGSFFGFGGTLVEKTPIQRAQDAKKLRMAMVGAMNARLSSEYALLKPGQAIGRKKLVAKQEAEATVIGGGLKVYLRQRGEAKKMGKTKKKPKQKKVKTAKQSKK